MRIMIVDDDPLVNQSLKIILEQDSTIEVVSMCGSGREAIDAYPEVRPDVVLSDIRMEDTDGLDATAEILKLDPQAKVILLTT
ncbi:MAG: response regulator transcription factor, partial [Clostridiales bacterium]|nr:response regulator transcription factor [Clostridiales bacterium]